MRLLLLFSYLTLFGTNCLSQPPPPPVHNPDSEPDAEVDASLVLVVDEADAAPLPADAPPPKKDDCALGEENLLRLGCKDSRGRLLGGRTLRGVPWAQLCRTNRQYKVDMRPTCMALSKSCEEVQLCR